jgi:hypothetical protein
MHDRVAHWIQAETLPVTLTCSITELGFVRMLSNASAYGFTVAHTQAPLKQLKESPVYMFALIADQNGASLLPDWVKVSLQTADVDPVQLAKTHGAVLATLDANIPGVFMIG